MLGGVAPTQLTNSNDLDNVVTPGLYQIKDGVAPSNVPQWAGLNDLIEVKAWYNGTMIVQTVYEANNSGNASGYRVRFKDGAWKPWHRVYNDSLLTDSSLLGPLASALGGLKFSMYPPDVVNLKQGVYLAASTVDGGSTITSHLPGPSWYYLICFERHQGGNIVFAIKTDGSIIYVTTPEKDASTVTWYKYQGTSV